jgi:dihydrofolate reductase
MKVTLFMAVSINGYVAGPDDYTDWVKDTQILAEIIREKGACLMGRRTYDICLAYNDFPFKNALNVVITHDKNLITKSTSTEIFTDTNLSDLILDLEGRGKKELVVLGGGNINTLFLKDKLIDEIIVDVHPIILSSGTKLFENIFPSVNLEFLATKSLDSGMVQIKYRVLK